MFEFNQSDKDRLSAVIFEEGNMRAVAHWYAERGDQGVFRRWDFRYIQLEMKGADSMGRPGWFLRGEEMRSSHQVAYTEHSQWLYYVLINRAEQAVKEYNKLPDHQKPRLAEHAK